MPWKYPSSRHPHRSLWNLNAWGRDDGRFKRLWKTLSLLFVYWAPQTLIPNSFFAKKNSHPHAASLPHWNTWHSEDDDVIITDVTDVIYGRLWYVYWCRLAVRLKRIFQRRSAYVIYSPCVAYGQRLVTFKVPSLCVWRTVAYCIFAIASLFSWQL
jgi:hypothetical protein